MATVQGALALPAQVCAKRRPAAMDWCERAAAALLLVASVPVLLAAAFAIAILSGRSPFVRHWRVGQGGRPIGVLKLRTMWRERRRGFQMSCLVEDVFTQAISDLPKTEFDARITSRVARLCRRYSVDELPQLINVIRGEMGLVGPRPITEQELVRHYGPHAAEVLSIRPGITGLWQTQGRSRLSFEERLRCDLELVRNGSAALYALILARTILCVIKGESAW